MRWLRATVVVVAGLGCSVPGVAQERAAGRLTLDECLRIALTEHPLLRASAHRREAAQARVVQARALPQPTFEFDSDLQPQPFNFAGSGESYVGLSQAFEFPGRRALRASIVQREADAAGADVDLVRLERRFEVKAAFYQLLRAEDHLRHAQQDLELAGEFLKTTEARFNAGDIARVEVIRARVEAAQAANVVRASSAAVRFARAALNVQLGRPQGTPVEIVGELKVAPLETPAEELRRAALEARPEIRRLALELEAETLKQTEARRGNLPDVELGVARHKIDGEGTSWDVTVSVPVPLFFRQTRLGPLAEAVAVASALRRELDQQRHAIGLEVEGALVEAETSWDQIRHFEEQILKEAEEVYTMLQFSFQQGEIGGLDLIAARRTLVGARLGYVDALYNHAVALAAVEKAAGR